MTQSTLPTRCGYVGIVGRPNVGKSTLLNHLLGQKLSITSRKPQTTRHVLLGILSEADTQFIFVDTPGLQDQVSVSAVNRNMNRAARSVVSDVDIILFLVDRDVWLEQDKKIADLLAQQSTPVLLLINKVDLLQQKEKLLPHIDKLAGDYNFELFMPISALQRSRLPALLEEIRTRLPEAPFMFPEEQISDRSERFFAAEIVREKSIRQLGKELPYAIAVQIEQFKRTPGLLTIAATLYVERAGQKAIVIGHQGKRLKKLGEDARLEMETFFQQKVMLKLWVKVRAGWSNDERALKSLGLDSS